MSTSPDWKETAIQKRLLTLCLVVAMPVAAMHPAHAATPEITAAISAEAASETLSQTDFSDAPETPTEDIHEQLDSELKYLSGLPADELDAELQSLERNNGTAPRVAPLVIVAAIGCAVGIGGAVFTKSWEDPNNAVWSLAGVPTACIPGAQQVKLVKVIMNNKQMIATALKKVGAFSLAAAILGANIAPVATAPNE